MALPSVQRTDEVPPLRLQSERLTLTKFTDLGLDAALLKALEGEGYTAPTPIQAQAIPGVMAGRDLLGIAQTGTGKTAAFALPILHRLNADRRPAPRRGARCIVLSPTRELATQIGESFKTYGRHLGVTVAVVFGGVAHRPQREALARGVDVLVATPGRLIDHITERNASIETTEILVLDEADQMLDMGFIRPIRQILSKLPSRRQSLFFSATMPHEIGALAAEMLRDPLSVAVTPVAKTADRVAQKVIHVEAPKKKALLAELFADQAMSRTLVFTRTKRGADRVAKYLETAGVGVAAIHGNKSQAQRERALADFKSGRIRGLIATDIAARGIDIDLVTHVVNYELPNIPESYVHRIGRTARAGAEGIAISLCDGEERAYLRDIERLTRQQIPSEDRRGDTTLAAEQRGQRGHASDEDGEAQGERRERREHRSHQGGSRGGDRSGRSGAGQRERHDRHNAARGESRGEAHRAHRGDGERTYRAERGEHPQRGHREHASAERSGEAHRGHRGSHAEHRAPRDERSHRAGGASHGERHEPRAHASRHEGARERTGHRDRTSAETEIGIGSVRFLSGTRRPGAERSAEQPRHQRGSGPRQAGGGRTSEGRGHHHGHGQNERRSDSRGPGSNYNGRSGDRDGHHGRPSTHRHTTPSGGARRDRQGH